MEWGCYTRPRVAFRHLAIDGPIATARGRIRLTPITAITTTTINNATNAIHRRRDRTIDVLSLIHISEPTRPY